MDAGGLPSCSRALVRYRKGRGGGLPLIDDAVLVEVQLLEDPVGHVDELLGEVELPYHLADIRSLLQKYARPSHDGVFHGFDTRRGVSTSPHTSIGQPEAGSIATALKRSSSCCK